MNATGTDLTDQFPVQAEALRRLNGRLANEADNAGALDIAYRTIETSIGVLLLAATGAGLVRVAFAREGLDEVLGSLAERISPRILESPRRLDDTARQLEEYFSGRRKSFDLPLDRQLSTGFRLSIHEYLPQIDFGRTMTYKQVAQNVGNPNAVRAVGTACATNPLPVIIPCHRVLRSDGSPGGYLGGVNAKTTLLDLERAA